VYKEFEHAENSSIVDFRKPGQLIGLADIFNTSIVQFSVAALNDCEVCSIDIRLFENLLNGNGSFAVDVIRSINNQTSSLINFHIQNNYKQLHGRIAHAILILANTIFESDYFDIPFTRRDFAEFTNMSSMSVVRILKVFRNDKLIEMKDGLITILDKDTGHEVAFFRGHMSPDKLGTFLDKWGRIYNDALMVVEVNNHGLTTITALKNKQYPQLYFRPATKMDTMSQKFSDRLGWKTTKLTRPLMIDDLREALADGSLKIHSSKTLDEMLTFVFNDDGNMVCQSSFFDDCIFCTAIGYQGFKVCYSGKLEQIDESECPSSGF
jgi:CRP-like cAMP-binding protein